MVNYKHLILNWRRRYVYEGKLYTGKVFRRNVKDEIMEVWHMKKGLYHGSYIMRDPLSDQISCVQNYHKGKLHGIQNTYSRFDNKLINISIYRKGKLHGTCIRFTPPGVYNLCQYHKGSLRGFFVAYGYNELPVDHHEVLRNRVRDYSSFIDVYDFTKLEETINVE